MNTTAIDRRYDQPVQESTLKRSINDDQLVTLGVLERFGWTLKFVRRTSAGPLAAVLDPDRHSLAIIEPDGELNETGSLAFRS